MKRLFIYIFAISFLLSNAQNFDLSMNVTKADLSISSYDKDPSAEAVMIYDYGKSYFNKETWRLNFELKQKFKILSKMASIEGKKKLSYMLVIIRKKL